MNFKIPSDVEVDDKILYFLTIKQLVILVIWWSISYLIFITMAKAWFLAAAWGPIVIPIAIITVMIAFLKINHLPFHKWMILLAARIIIPQKRYWNNRYAWAINIDALSGSSTWSKKKKISEWKWGKQSEAPSFSDLVRQISDRKNENIKDELEFNPDEEMQNEFKRLDRT